MFQLILLNASALTVCCLHPLIRGCIDPIRKTYLSLVDNIFLIAAPNSLHEQIANDLDPLGNSFASHSRVIAVITEHGS
jgi:hypothetical protein